MVEFTFDVKAFAIVRVKANDEAAARAMLGPFCDFMAGKHWRDGDSFAVADSVAMDGEADLLEIYVECSFETCRKRDVKGLYKRAHEGQVPNFTGKESAFEPPARPHLILNTESTSLEDSLETLYSFVLGHIRTAP